MYLYKYYTYSHCIFVSTITCPIISSGMSSDVKGKTRKGLYFYPLVYLAPKFIVELGVIENEFKSVTRYDR